MKFHCTDVPTRLLVMFLRIYGIWSIILPRCNLPRSSHVRLAMHLVREVRGECDYDASVLDEAVESRQETGIKKKKRKENLVRYSETRIIRTEREMDGALSLAKWLHAVQVKFCFLGIVPFDRLTELHCTMWYTTPVCTHSYPTKISLACI